MAATPFTDRMIRLISIADSILTHYKERRKLILATLEAERERHIEARNAISSVEERLGVSLWSDEEFRSAISIYLSSLQTIDAIVHEQLPIPYKDIEALAEERTHFRLRAKSNLANRKAQENYRVRRWQEQHPGEDYPYRQYGPKPARARDDNKVTYIDENGKEWRVSQAWIDAHEAQQRDLQSRTNEAVSIRQPTPSAEDPRAAYERDRAERQARDAQALPTDLLPRPKPVER